MNKTALALLLLTSTLLAMNATLQVSVQGNKIYLNKLVATKEYTGKLASNVIKSHLSLITSMKQEGNIVIETFKSDGSSELKSSLIKRGRMQLDFAMSSNATSADLKLRVRGNVLVSLIYIRNSDLLILISINKNAKEGTVKINGFVSLATPVTTVKNLLKLQVPKIKENLKKNGVNVIKFDYKVTGKRLPPISKVELDIILKMKKKDLENILSKFGLDYLLNYAEINDNVTRTITGSGTVNARVRTVTKNEIPIFFTLMNFQGKATGKYLNTTVTQEIKNRIKLLSEILNISNIANYIGNVKSASSKFSLQYSKGKTSAVVTFNGVYLLNTKTVWNALYELSKKEGIKILVVCGKNVFTLKSPSVPCK